MLRMLLFSAIACLLTTTMDAAVKVEKIAYKGWPNCYLVSNGEIELIVTADVGPRIIRFGFVGGQNLFKEYPEQLGKIGEATFQLRGGDRIWKSPEDLQITWAPDNVPVHIKVTANGLIARAPVEPTTGLEKEIEVRMPASGTSVTVAHRITNRSGKEILFAPWVLTMMAPGGVAVSAFPPRGKHPEHLSPTNPLVMWAYTDFSDPRWKFTRKYLILRQDANSSEPQKAGTFNPDTWATYILNGQAFIKRAAADPGRTYPDFGSSFEMFTSNEFLEMETLGPLANVRPGQTVEQVESWGIFGNINLAQWNDEELDRVVLPLVQAVGSVR